MKNFKVATTSANNKEALEIVISGDLTIKNVGDFYKRLNEIKRSFKVYNIFLQELQKIDVACLQVLIAYISDLKKNSKQVSLTKNINEELHKLLQNADMLNNNI